MGLYVWAFPWRIASGKIFPGQSVKEKISRTNFPNPFPGRFGKFFPDENPLGRYFPNRPGNPPGKWVQELDVVSHIFTCPSNISQLMFIRRFISVSQDYRQPLSPYRLSSTSFDFMLERTSNCRHFGPKRLSHQEMHRHTDLMGLYVVCAFPS